MSAERIEDIVEQERAPISQVTSSQTSSHYEEDKTHARRTQVDSIMHYVDVGSHFINLAVGFSMGVVGIGFPVVEEGDILDLEDIPKTGYTATPSDLAIPFVIAAGLIRTAYLANSKDQGPWLESKMERVPEKLSQRMMPVYSRIKTQAQNLLGNHPTPKWMKDTYAFYRKHLNPYGDSERDKKIAREVMGEQAPLGKIFMRELICAAEISLGYVLGQGVRNPDSIYRFLEKCLH